MIDVTPHWSESDSQAFIDFGKYFVPERETQLDLVCSLIEPSPPPFNVVELCFGEGLLTRALLSAFPEATVHAYDGSPTMLAFAAAIAAEFPGRLSTRTFDLFERDWRRFDFPVRAIVSQLGIHHLDDGQKRALFADLAGALEPGGALVVADVIRPANDRALAVAAREWDDEVRRRSLADGRGGSGFEAFERTKWNIYRYPEASPTDLPSTVLQHLVWFEGAGLTGVDVAWMKAGHAIFCGYKPAA